MPRKKKQKPLTVVAFADPKTKALLAFINGLPPVHYWNISAEGDSQREHFKDVQCFYQMLKHELELYFGGQASDIPLLTEKDRNAMGHMLNRHLAWYGVVQYAWRYIERDLPDLLERIRVSNPFEALLYLLQQECDFAMSESTVPYCRFSPSAERSFEKEGRAIEHDFNLSKVENPTEKRISKYNGIAKQKNNESKPYFAALTAMFEVCSKRSQDDEPLAKRIALYQEYQADVEQQARRMLSTREGMKGVEWINGQKKSLARG